MLKKIFLAAISLGCLSTPAHVYAQKKEPVPPAKPKLVIGIVIDQMRYDFLYRYAAKYGKGGFRRLMNEGFNSRNAQYPYVPTYTAPGHSSIFTGSIPAINGMVANDWYSRSLKREIYCTDDSTVHTVGSTGKAGEMSPRNLLVTTITDQLRLSDNFRSRVIGISQKDRASILPAGHTANAAYWLDSQSGNFITSTYYMAALPAWVTTFNALKSADSYLSKPWNTLLPIDTYTESTADNMAYENPLPGETSPVFPHDLPGIRKKDTELIKSTPFGNSLSKDFAISCIEHEQLGKKGATDFLTLSFSSTDYVGHSFGPNSIEIEDTYLRLDRTLSELLSFLDSYLGKENVLVFLTADHGVASIPAFNEAHQLPGTVVDAQVLKQLKTIAATEFGDANLIEHIVNDEIYLDHALMKQKKISRTELYTSLKEALQHCEGIHTLLDLNNLSQASLPESEISFFKNGFNEKRSGDFQIVTEPGSFFGHAKGTTHGSYGTYDTHVPLLWYGWTIKNGESSERVSITDIAPTLANMLDIMEPSGSIGKVLPVNAAPKLSR